jgi:lipopolysaccharide transport system permease protein
MSVEITHNNIDSGARRRIKSIRPPSFSVFDIFPHLSELFRYRDLLWTLSVHRVKVRYKQSLLGISWAILQPLSLMLIYTAIFSTVAQIKSDGVPYAVFAYSALLPWTAFSTALTNATNGLVSHQQLVTKVYFPREILPLTYVFAAMFDFAIGSTVLGGLMIYYRVPLTLNILYAIPVILLLIAFATSAAFVFSATQVRFRDIGVAMPLLLQLWMFASPVVYPLSAVPAKFQFLYMLNPMAGIIDGFRRLVVQGLPPDVHTIVLASLVVAVLLPASYMYFKRVDATVADVI